ncbi:MAG: RNA polymerase factor sigma-54 [candidate division WOR-3 bacterium]
MEEDKKFYIQKLRHGLRLEQKLSPLQVLMIKILQCPHLELKDLIRQEIERNPLLIMPEEEIPERIEIEEPPSSEDEESTEKLLNKELRDFFKEDFINYFTPSEEEESEGLQIPYVSTPYEELKMDLRMELSDEKLIEVGEYIIDSLNDNGFLDIPLPTIAEYFNIPEKDVEKVLKIIQDCAPPGIGARNEREAIRLYLERNYEDPKLELTIVNDFWEEYKKKEIKKIATKLNISLEEVKNAIKKIGKITPRLLGSSFGEVNYVIPSIIVEKEDKELKISINEPELPFFRLNPKYIEILQAPEKFDKKTIKFVEKWMERIRIILQTLELRKKNFRKVIEYILNTQKEFIEKGVMYMKPLSLKKIAENTNLSESTISRYIKDTYIQTPKGVFPIKYLLSGGLKTETQSISTNLIREKIKRMIESEGSKKLSDIEIKKELEKEGININRRTVAKYRTQMGIPPKSKRKKEVLD